MARLSQAHLHLLGQRDDITLVEIHDSVNIDLARVVHFSVSSVYRWTLSVCSDILSISGGLLEQPLKKLPFDFWFSNKCLQSFSVRVQDMRDECSGILHEFRFRDKFAWKREKCSRRKGNEKKNEMKKVLWLASCEHMMGTSGAWKGYHTGPSNEKELGNWP